MAMTFPEWQATKGEGYDERDNPGEYLYQVYGAGGGYVPGLTIGPDGKAYWQNPELEESDVGNDPNWFRQQTRNAGYYGNDPKITALLNQAATISDQNNGLVPIEYYLATQQAMQPFARSSNRSWLDKALEQMASTSMLWGPLALYGAGAFSGMGEAAGAGSLGLDAAIPQFGMEAATAADYAALGLGEAATGAGTFADLATESQYLDAPFDPSNYTYPPGTPDLPLTPPGGPPGTQGTTPITPGTQPGAPVTDLSTAASAADIARIGTGATAAGTALSRLLGLTQEQADLLSLGGTAGKMILDWIAGDEAQGTLEDYLNRQQAGSAPSLARFNESFAPGFTVPGSDERLARRWDIGLRQGSARAGNVMDNPGVLAQINRDIALDTQLPELQEYRRVNLAGSGIANMNAAAPQMTLASIANQGNTYGSMGYGLGELLNQAKPQQPTFKFVNGGWTFA